MDTLVDYFLQHHDKLLYLLAGVCLVVELTIMGLSGPLLFFSIGCTITGLLVTMGIFSGWELEVLSVGIFSMLSALILWQPLKTFQGVQRVSDQSSDMIGQIVAVSAPVNHTNGCIRYSGINWQARLDDNSPPEALLSGSRAEIIAVEGNVMIITAHNSKQS